jgi:hypothetical protein
MYKLTGAKPDQNAKHCKGDAVKVDRGIIYTRHPRTEWDYYVSGLIFTTEIII